ncbi:hypothetical protein [Brachyspira sp.]|uniref:hypothetical protein n=1 Tax=Brachyspira sp. TaxID=1977261 RepID=UPI003D7C927B
MSIFFGGIIYIIYYTVRWFCTDWCPEADFYRREADRLRKMKEENEEEYNNYINEHDDYYRRILGISSNETVGIQERYQLHEPLFTFEYETVEIEGNPITTNTIISKNWDGLYEKKLLLEADISYDFYRRIILKELEEFSRLRGALSYYDILYYTKYLKNKRNYE